MNVSRSITFSDQKVEDVGTHSAGLKAHYTIDEKLLPDVAKVCYSTALLRVFSVQGKATNSDWQVCLGSPLWDCTTGRVDDDDRSLFLSEPHLKTTVLVVLSSHTPIVRLLYGRN